MIKHLQLLYNVANHQQAKNTMVNLGYSLSLTYHTLDDPS